MLSLGDAARAEKKQPPEITSTERIRILSIEQHLGTASTISRPVCYIMICVITRSYFGALATVTFCACAFGQDAIRFLPDKKLWVLDTNNSSYVFGVNERGQLQHIYWGKKLWCDADLASAHSSPEWASFDGSASTTPGEYAGWGSNMYTEPCLKVTL